MLQHYADLVLAKKGGRRVDWISVTAEMSALGFKTTTGEPLKPETVRRTWHRLDADVAAGVVVPPAGSPGSHHRGRRSALCPHPCSLHLDRP